MTAHLARREHPAAVRGMQRYELVLDGEIGDRFGLLFEGMRLERAAGRTILTGAVLDQAHLHGLIEQVQELGLELVSVNPVDAQDPGRVARRDQSKGQRMTPDTIVLVHGFWMTPRSWEHWITHYEGKGFRVLAPAYPGFEVEVEALNADATPIERGDGARRSSSSTRRSSVSSTRRRSSSATRPVARSRRSCSTAATAPRESR